jgi:xylose isomerase
MRSYLILRAKAKRFAEDAEIQAALEAAGANELAQPSVGPYSRDAAGALLSETMDPAALALRGYHNDKLDQLVMELLMGVR